MEAFGLTIASLLAQAIASLLLAGFIALILRSKKRRYLRQLALAFAALAVCIGASAISLALAETQSALNGTTRFLSLLGLSMLFPHLIWLWLGSRGAMRQGSLSVRQEYWGVILAAIAGACLAWAAADHASPSMAVFLRITAPYLIAGIVYLALALRLFRLRAVTGRLQISPLIAVSAFSAFGLYLLYGASFGAWMVFDQGYDSYAQLSGIVGLIILMTIALSLVSWLLETEQQRSAYARDQARNAEQRLRYFRSHDPATGLPNRQQLQNLLGKELVKLRHSPQQHVGVLALGLHRYKMMSESMGWQRAEDMIRDLTRRISEYVPAHFVLGRIGERDFVLLMPKLSDQAQAQAHASELLERLRRPFKRDDRELFLKISGGLSVAPNDARDATDLIRLAVRAQLQAIGLGEDLLIHRAGADGHEPRDLLQMEAELRRAQQRGEFKLFFQPVISIPQRCIRGFEALLRWEHPQRGLLNPDYFLQEASALGLLDELEDTIFSLAFQQLSDWTEDMALPPVNLSINVSPRRFVQPDLSEQVAAHCRCHHISPDRVTLEITESTAITDFEAALETIAGLRAHGIKVSLDDFGTGYSALAHLRRLNVDTVKLDRSFVSDIESDERQLALTRSVVDLIHSLGMQVVAEGVETRAQLGHMIQCRVDYVQGYLFGEPQPAENYRRALEQRDISQFRGLRSL